MVSETETTFDVVAFVMDYEDGLLTEDQTIAGFAELIRSGLAWALQGHYGRMAQALIDAGIVTPEGEVVSP